MENLVKYVKKVIYEISFCRASLGLQGYSLIKANDIEAMSIISDSGSDLSVFSNSVGTLWYEYLP